MNEFSERMLDKRARRRGPLKWTSASDQLLPPTVLPIERNRRRREQQQQQPEQNFGPFSQQISITTNLSQRLAGVCESRAKTMRRETNEQQTQGSRVTCIAGQQQQEQMDQRRDVDLRCRRREHNGRSARTRRISRAATAAITTVIASSGRSVSAGRLASLFQLASLSLLLVSAASGALGRRDSSGQQAAAVLVPISSSSAASATSQQQQQSSRALQLLAESDKQLNLLRSANVELNRRGDRLQRDTPPPTPEAGGQSAPTCGYPGSPAHASVTFNTSLVVAGTAASYTCDNGYELLGPPRRLCQANGTWAPVGIPFCVLNVGLGKAAMQSSTAGHGSAQKAVDGSTSPYFQASTCTMTDVEHNPWWYVNLLEPYLVQIVRIDFGTACCANRQKATIAVRVGNNRPDLGNNPLCNRYHGFIEEGKPLFLPCTRPAPGAFVSIHLESPSGSSLSICETFIYTDHALSIEQCPSFRDQPLGSTATYNGKCYLFHNNQALNFDGARKYCESRGGSLVDETSPALQGFLSWELYRRHRNDQLMGQYWLGAVKDQRNPQNWKWISGKDVQISFWNSLGSQGNCSRFDGSKGWLWSDTDCNAALNFICQYRPLSCGKPEKPTNSTLVTKNIDNGTVIEYQCAPGNLLMGPKSRACLPTGFFSEFAPKCKYLDCQFPAMIPDGDYKLLNGTTSYQSVVNYFCQDGYQIYGKATLSCDVDERWNGPPPRCEPLLCPAPVPPSNGYVTVSSNVTVPGTQATYDCRPGYELVGDRLLTCSPAGSWDNSFPYCREKRPTMPHLLHLNTNAPVTPAPASANRGQQQVQPSSKPAGAVQFPPSSANFSPNRIGPTSSTLSPPQSSPTQPTPAPQPSSATVSPASLNGLTGQFVPPPSGGSSSQVNGASEQSRRPPVAAEPSPPPPPVAETVGSSQSPALLSTQQPRPSRPNQSGSVSQGGSSTSTASSSGQQSFTTPALTVASSSSSNSPRLQQAASKFSFLGQQQPTISSQVSYDSTPLATTNSISVHHQQQHHPVSSVVASSTPSSTSTTTNSLVGSGSTPTSPSSPAASLAGSNQQQQNVLASFQPPVRSQNTLASARYSLDGIIAVAIFGGFIFLGAIITIIVIIIRRRKSSHSSTIDAQTISTYDSNGEHNGLYRNYQQAWENLRFATPSSQPKMSGSAGLITAHVNGGPSVGMKNFAAPSLAMVHHAHHQMHQPHGHHNLAMAAPGGSGSSSQGSSLAGCAGANPLGSGGGDPLLRGHLAHAHALYQHQSQASHHLIGGRRRRGDEEEDDDDLDGDGDGSDQGVLTSDEANYRGGDEAGEGFRDSNELTINADTALVNGQAAARRRIYSTNSIGRAMAAHRLSSNLSGAGSSADHSRHQHSSHRHQPHPHQQQARHAASSGGSQHQRLVSNSTTPSTSTRSSRASPPSDDQSLDQLAYGNGWHATSAAGNHQQQDSSSQSHSAGSGASILGGGRANLRYQ